MRMSDPAPGRVVVSSASMQCGNKQDIIVVGQLVFVFTFEFPVGVIDQDEDARTTGDVMDEVSFRTMAGIIKERTLRHPR